MFAFPNNVHCKSVDNIISCLLKLLAIGCLWGSGTYSLLSDLETAACFNTFGLDMINDAQVHYIIFACSIVFSSLASFSEAPLSALYGGKLKVIPVVPGGENDAI